MTEVNHWALLTYTAIAITGGFKIVVTTDVECRLYMRWTTFIPQKHLIPVMRRGIAIHDTPRICFVSYHQNDQQEPGQSLTHTFIKLNWPICQTRWFYFIGTILGVQSPSTSGIFELHRYRLPDCQLLMNGNPLAGQGWAASSQTFQPEAKYTAKSLWLPLNKYRTDLKGHFKVLIEADHFPCWEAPVFWQITWHTNDIPDPGSQEGVTFDLENLTLYKEILYRITVHTIPPWYWWNGHAWEQRDNLAVLKWWWYAPGDPYPRGMAFWGCDYETHHSGWSGLSTTDFAFCIT